MKKLTTEEIKKIEDEIWREENISPSNKYYFSIPKKVYSTEGYILDGYYINLNYLNGIWWLGIIKINSECSLNRLLFYFKKLIKDKKVIGIWRDKDNGKIEGLFKAVSRYFNSDIKSLEDKEYIIIKEEI